MATHTDDASRTADVSLSADAYMCIRQAHAYYRLWELLEIDTDRLPINQSVPYARVLK